MELSKAVTLIRKGIRNEDAIPQTWVDIGAGSGLFTQALATLLPSGSHIYAVDKDGGALDSIMWAHADKKLSRLTADVTQSLTLPKLDGALMANVLHYINDQAEFIQRLGPQLREHGALIIIEYDTNRSNRWVPFPISLSKMKELAALLRYSIVLLGTEPSKYNSGSLYSVLLQSGEP